MNTFKLTVVLSQLSISNTSKMPSFKIYALLALPYFLPVSATTTSAGCQGGLYATVASILSGYGPAQTYCSSKYPVPKATSTVVGTTTTVTTTVATITVPTTCLLYTSPSPRD